MASGPSEKLLRLVLEYVDFERLLAEHPEIDPGEVERLMARFRSGEQRAEARRPQARRKSVVAHCDGASRGNPGPAAIGVVLRDASGNELATISETIGRTTNNVAEYAAVIRAAQKARELGATELTLLLDSELLVYQLNGTYRVRATHLRSLHRRALQALAHFARWKVKHVPRRLNARADALANAALDNSG